MLPWEEIVTFLTPFPLISRLWNEPLWATEGQFVSQAVGTSCKSDWEAEGSPFFFFPLSFFIRGYCKTCLAVLKTQGRLGVFMFVWGEGGVRIFFRQHSLLFVAAQVSIRCVPWCDCSGGGGGSRTTHVCLLWELQHRFCWFKVTQILSSLFFNDDSLSVTC